MTALVLLLRTILGDQFPTGLLVVVGLALLWRDTAYGLQVLGVAIWWHYFTMFLGGYGSRDGRPVMTAGRVTILILLRTFLMASTEYALRR